MVRPTQIASDGNANIQMRINNINFLAFNYLGQMSCIMFSKNIKKCRNCHNALKYEISNYYIKKLLRYSEISWFYVDFNHSFGRGMLFYQNDKSKISKKM